MPGDDRPGYRLIADALAAGIADGRYPLRSKLPGRRKLADEFGVTETTVARALRVLAEQGLVQPVRGAGTEVVNTEPSEPKSDRQLLGEVLAQLSALRADVDEIKRRLEME